MKLSLFTPTHDMRHLKTAYEALALQDHADWEWVIVPNGPLASIAPNSLLPGDPRIRWVPDQTQSTHIGALKRFACEQCKGEAFIEYDHDDLLVPGILSEVSRAFEAGAGFVYSDSAVFEPDLRSWGYATSHGWEHYPLTVYGRQYTATKTFPVTPRSLCEVYYAPDHVRAWSRKAYWTAGGHNSKLSVGDDHELMCKTYLTGVPFVYTGGCGYLYRWHGGNTVKARSRLIQEQTAANKKKYLFGLVKEWTRREGLLTLDLLEEHKAKRWDRRDIPRLMPNRYGQIIASDVLQFQDPTYLQTTMAVLWDALVPGGFLHIVVPHDTGRYAAMNPEHRIRFNENSFFYYTRREFAQSIRNQTARFDGVIAERFYPDKETDPDQNFRKHRMRLLRVDLAALKGQRHPGPKLI